MALGLMKQVGLIVHILIILFSSFNNAINSLKDFFLSNGLWQTTIISDGKINKYNSNTKVDGNWWIEDNIFYFNYPDNETGGLDSKAYKIENNILYFTTDAKYTQNTRLYFDETKADAYFATLVGNQTDLKFTTNLLNNKTFYYIFVDYYNDAIYGIYKKSFTENKITTTNEYGYSYGDVNMTINNGDIEYESNGYKNVLDLTAENSDYLEYKGTKYHETDNEVTANYHGRLYYDETKAFEYQKTFEVYSNTFFNAGVTCKFHQPYKPISPKPNFLTF